jgi:hypothetical protein
VVRIGWRLEVHNRDFLFGEKMKIYMIVVFQLFLFAMTYGFIVPSLVSAKDSIAVAMGFLVAVVIAPSALLLIGKYCYYKHVKKDDLK